jgi:hypothetical protein
MNISSDTTVAKMVESTHKQGKAKGCTGRRQFDRSFAFLGDFGRIRII